MKEYAFDIKLFAVVRVEADSLADARRRVQDLQAIEIGYDADGVHITEGSTDGEPDLFEIDGEPALPEDEEEQ